MPNIDNAPKNTIHAAIGLGIFFSNLSTIGFREHANTNEINSIIATSTFVNIKNIHIKAKKPKSMVLIGISLLNNLIIFPPIIFNPYKNHILKMAIVQFVNKYICS